MATATRSEVTSLDIEGTSPHTKRASRPALVRIREPSDRELAQWAVAEARSLLAYSLLIGSYFIAAQHDGKRLVGSEDLR